jgi:hypothetical protein
MKIEVTRAFYLAGGKLQAVGDILEVDDRQGRELIHLGKASKFVEAPAEAPADEVVEAPAEAPKPAKGRK